MHNMTEFAKRRKQLMQKIGSDGIVILVSAPVSHRNNDCEYPYRQNSDFFYLTGFEEPEAIAIIAPKRKQGEFILFTRTRDRDQEIWHGRRAGQEGAREIFQADEAFPIQDFQKCFPELLERREHIHYTLGTNKTFETMLIKIINKIRGKIRSGTESPLAIIDVGHTIHEMRLIKSSEEIKLMRKAAEISSDAHIRAMQACKPGISEYQLEAEILHEFHRQGARFAAYNTIVGSGENTCILHYTENNRIIQKEDLVLIDAGCEYQNYAADITRTFPASGRFSGEQRAIYDIVLEAQLAAIKTIRPGIVWTAAQEKITKIITQGLKDLGLLKGSLDSLLEKHAYRAFYMHNSGHWLGLDVHDAGRYRALGKWRILEPGMALTVEPGIYISADLPNVPKRWHNIGIRIEDDLLVTKQGHEILTKKTPKTIDEIEAVMSA